MFKNFATTIPIIIKLIVWINSSLANANHSNHNIAIPCTATESFRRLAFLTPRGGGSSTDYESKTDILIASSDRHQQLIGVIDLRPNSQVDSIILAKECNDSNGDDSVDSGNFDVVQQANFPAAMIKQEDEILADDEKEEMMDQHAASSHTIGNLCSTVYLIIAYDFANGKTVLHSSLGGTKLMAFIDGVRGHWHEMSQSNAGETSAATKLVLLLVPSSTSSAIAPLSARFSSLKDNLFYDLTDSNNTDEWDATGANYLVDRLSEAFALGGEDYQKLEHPFGAEMVGVFDIEQQADDEMNGVVLRHIRHTLRKNNCSNGITVETTKSSIGEFEDLIKHTYGSAGGAVIDVNFQ